MLELAAIRAAVVGCYAAPAALERLTSAGATVCRIAPDEAMLVGSPGAVAELVRTTVRLLTEVDGDALALDITDGWAVWTLSGPESPLAFGRLSALRLADARFVQGNVANVAVRVVVASDRLHLIVPAMWTEHLRERILRDCADLGVRSSSARAWAVEDGLSA